MDDLLKLAGRCEKATADEQHALLIEAARMVFASDHETLRRFSIMASCGAFESAALTLLDEWSEYDLTNLYGVARAHVNMVDGYGGAHGSNKCGCMALALCAAALRALAGEKP